MDENRPLNSQSLPNQILDDDERLARGRPPPNGAPIDNRFLPLRAGRLTEGPGSGQRFRRITASKHRTVIVDILTAVKTASEKAHA